MTIKFYLIVGGGEAGVGDNKVLPDFPIGLCNVCMTV